MEMLADGNNMHDREMSNPAASAQWVPSGTRLPKPPQMREPRPGHAAGPQIIPTGGFEDKDNPYTRAFVKNYRKGVYHAKDKSRSFSDRRCMQRIQRRFPSYNTN